MKVGSNDVYRHFKKWNQYYNYNFHLDGKDNEGKTTRMYNYDCKKGYRFHKIIYQLTILDG